MPLTAKDVEEILRYLDASPFDELHLEMDGMTLHLRRTADGVEIADAPGARTAKPATEPPAPVKEAKTSAVAADGLTDIRSTFLGTFYRAPKPGEAPFVEVGSTVGPETVVCIVEVMKLMNSLHAGISGEIAEICARDGELVEYGQVLFRVREAAS